MNRNNHRNISNIKCDGINLRKIDNHLTLALDMNRLIVHMLMMNRILKINYWF
jgi:hypothetical protein